MKLFGTLIALFLFSAGYAAAQDLNGMEMTSYQASGSTDVTGFKTTEGPGINPVADKTPPNPHVVLKPQLGGILVDFAKYGPSLVSPVAPAAYGIGEKYLSAPSSRSDVQHESGPAAHRTTGGIKFFSIEF